MITSHLLQNSRLSSTHCLHLSLLATSSRVATLLRCYSNDQLVVRILGFEIHASRPADGSGLHTRSFTSHFRRASETGIPSLSPRFSVAARSAMDTAAAEAAEVKPEVAKADPIVQYIVLRKDLVETLKWPLGSVISQGCHAAVAAIILHKDNPSTAEYCGIENLDNMHTVTLEVKGETQLRNLAQKLEAGGVAHKLWIEQPEDFPTCLATRPYRKSEVASFFKSLKLCR